MSYDKQGGACLVASTLQPIIVRVAGSDRAALEDILELRGSCTYVALFNEHDPDNRGCYVGMTGCGQDRPRVGQHLAWPELASSIFVIADGGNRLTPEDAAVLERFLFAKITEVTTWKMRCERPRAGGVGDQRFAELVSFGSQVMLQLRVKFGLFPKYSASHIATAPRQFEPILYDLLQGRPEGEKMVLQGFGVEATGIDLGEEGFVICAGSVIRAEVVASCPQVNAARREELLFNGQLLRLTDELLFVRRDLWRPSPTSAARFVTGSSASSGNWRPAIPHLRLVRS